MSIKELLSALGENKKKSGELYALYKAMKTEEDVLKEELMASLKATGLKSAKGEDYTASISEKPNIVITSERDVMDWLENTPNVEADFYIGVKKPEFKTLALQVLKDSGEIINGTDLQTTESLAIRRN